MEFWKPGTVAPGSNVAVGKQTQWDREGEEEAVVAPYNPQAALPLAKQRVLLPVYAYRESILWAVERYPVVLLVGETGSGKTTQVPQYLVGAGWGRVVCSQPRRLAVQSVALRVAEERGEAVGRGVGYAMRFDDSRGAETRIEYLTDGMLLQEIQRDPLLRRYAVVMLDEVHERALHTDVLLGLLKKIQKKRPQLRLIVSSATLDAQDIRDFFNTNTTSDPSLDNVVILSVEGRSYPVEIHYTHAPVADYLTAAVETVLRIHRTQPPGDILVFLTGAKEIEDTVQALQEQASDPKYPTKLYLQCHALYAGLSMDRQMNVFSPTPPRTRKVIVATNIAETSLTIDGIVYVVDCGFVKVRQFSAREGVNRLAVVPIAQASAAQRAGRAGRVRAGKCYRLYTELTFRSLPPSPVPEIQRTDLSALVLQLQCLGIHDLLHFAFLSPPPPPLLIRALELLYSLQAIDSRGLLTPRGEKLAEWPVEPALGTALVRSVELECAEECLAIAALLSVQGLWLPTPNLKPVDAKRGFAVKEGDHVTLLNVWTLWLKHARSAEWCRQNHLNAKALARAADIRKQLRACLVRAGFPIKSTRDAATVRRAFLGGYFSHAARAAPDGTYRSLRDGATLQLPLDSALAVAPPPFLFYHEVVQVDRLRMRECSAIDPRWLREAAPHYYDFHLDSELSPDQPEPPSLTHRHLF